MRCHICNRVLETPKFNNDHQEYDPCDVCLEVIEDTVAGFTDKASADEDAFVEEPIEVNYGLYPEDLENEG